MGYDRFVSYHLIINPEIGRQGRIATFIQNMLDSFPGVLDVCFKFLKRLKVIILFSFMQQLNKFVPVGFVFVISVIIRILNEVLYNFSFLLRDTVRPAVIQGLRGIRL